MRPATNNCAASACGMMKASAKLAPPVVISKMSAKTTAEKAWLQNAKISGDASSGQANVRYMLPQANDMGMSNAASSQMNGGACRLAPRGDTDHNRADEADGNANDAKLMWGFHFKQSRQMLG